MDKKVLTRRMYITYKSRINAAERLKKTNNFIQGINIYYSLFLTTMSIYSVNFGTPKLSLIITVYSVIITVTIVFLAAQNYGERAKSLKNNYVAISNLQNQLKEDMQQEQIQEISNEYDELIKNSENHSEYDYRKAIINIEGEKLKIVDRIIYYCMYYGSIILKLFLIIFPFLLRYMISLLEYLTKA